MKEKESIFLSADISVELWDQASGQKPCALSIKKSVFKSCMYSKRPAHPALVVPVNQKKDKSIVNWNRIVNQ